MKALLQPEKLFSLTMWSVAVLFAWFLVGFGGLVIRDLPLAEHTITPQQFATPELITLQASRSAIELEQRQKIDQRDLLQQSLVAAQSQYDTEHSNFQNWLATRAATNQSNQDSELIARTKRLEELKTSQMPNQRQVADLDRQLLLLAQRSDQLDLQYRPLEQVSNQRYQRAVFKQQLTIFAYRLLFILPLMVLALWLFVRQRKSKYWPFVWGFIFFSLFSFFVELVPYLPSYGGYVRYIVGLMLVLVGGYYGIGWMQAYLIQRQLTAKASENERRLKIDHIIAIKKLTAHVCPGCERQIVDCKEIVTNFCMYCGLKLYCHCLNCNARHNSFFSHCPTCGSGNQNKAEPQI
jgi:hypothetical protein